MSDELAELSRRLVIGQKRDGRSVYDAQAKAELVAECGKAGASVSRLARECGVNANQLSRWVREHEQRQRQVAAVEPSVPAMSFVPVQIEHAQQLPSTVMVKLQARLPNGVVLDVHDCDIERAGELIEALARLRCSA